METKLNTVNMTAWLHKECDIMDEDPLLRIQGAWGNPQQKDKCSVHMNDLEWDYWMGTKDDGDDRAQAAVSSEPHMIKVVAHTSRQDELASIVEKPVFADVCDAVTYLVSVVEDLHKERVSKVAVNELRTRETLTFQSPVVAFSQCVYQRMQLPHGQHEDVDSLSGRLHAG